MPWSPDEITRIEIEPGLSVGDVVTIAVSTPAGTIHIMGPVDIDGRALVITGAHVQGAAPGVVGIANTSGQHSG